LEWHEICFLPWQEVVRTVLENLEDEMEIPIYDVPAKMETS